MLKLTGGGLTAEWHRAMAAAFGSMASFAELAGETIDQVRRKQIYGWNACLLAGTRQIRRTLETINPVMSGPARLSPVALVTGGIYGLGTAICQSLAQAGHRVVATYGASEEEAAVRWQCARRMLGYDIAIVECEMSSFESCAQMAKRVQARFGPVGVLVNCAGGAQEASMDHRMGQYPGQAVLDADLDSVFNVTRNILQGMTKQRCGRIINICSMTAQTDPRGRGKQWAAKAGVLGFTQSLARELAGLGITVNTVSTANPVIPLPPGRRAGATPSLRVRQRGRPEDIAQAVAFLAGNGNMTGRDIAVPDCPSL